MITSLRRLITRTHRIAADVRARSVLASPASPASPAHKKVKILPDLDVLRAERDALEELGDTNWVGRLLGKELPRILTFTP